MPIRALGVIAIGLLSVFAFVPTAALAADTGDAGSDQGTQTATVAPSPTPANVLPELEGLAGRSIASATSDPDNPFTPFPVTKSFQDGYEEGNTRLTNGQLVSEVVLSGGGVRSVASLDAQVCPDEQGRVSVRIKMIIGSGSDTTDDRVIGALATGTVNDNAELTSSAVNVTHGTRKDAVLLQRLGRSVLRQAEQGWRNGLCVKVDVSEGQSRTVSPKEAVPISATAEPRSGAGPIKGRMEARKTAGQKKVTPALTSVSPAKFTYTAPDQRPEAGSVTLRSVSRRGIGTTNLEYTTAADLKIDSSGVTTVKCGGPEGNWVVLFEARLGGSGGAVVGSATATFTLADGSLTGPYAFSGSAETGVGLGSFGETGTASYAAAADGTSGTLTFSERGSYPVTIGTYCTNGVATGT